MSCMLCFKHCGAVKASKVNGYDAFQTKIGDAISRYNGTGHLFFLYSVGAHPFFLLSL